MSEYGSNGRDATREWGRRIDTRRLEDLYAPQEVKPHAVPPGGIDNLGLESRDVFLIPGQGELEVAFRGYFRVAREDPTTEDWDTAAVYVNIVELYLEGESDQLGTIRVRLNSDRTSPGQTFGPALAGRTGAAKCRIATAATFEAERFESRLFNKEPILLMNDAIEAIPPVEDPNGEAFIYMLPLSQTEDPDGAPAAYLQSLRYTVGNYLSEDEVEGLRSGEKRYH